MGKVLNPLIPPSYRLNGIILFFYKAVFGIRYPTKVDISLNKETELREFINSFSRTGCCCCYYYYHHNNYHYYFFETFSHQRTPIVSHWSLNDSKSPQVSRTLLRILTDHFPGEVIIIIFILLLRSSSHQR